ncbi:ABC transporter ATP-binding protein [Egibacter rhizosphaerae]|uniref:ABC transporter ATP-binding protein n=1 Tax=Egibacter rhizosphaerae TaxID=1670831 RepID=A0A411YJJ9_9ACTN|nr:ABC transporter ATP-binding protein [Egibacter rhizosphaerae]QBI21351.1 ABC transporter ATP-binding protein [Egibacter rhizosphaerae]
MSAGSDAMSAGSDAISAGSAAASPSVAVERVSAQLGDVVALWDVSARVGPGITALLGPNGAGKTTLVRLVCGLLPASQGTVRVGGRDPRSDHEARRGLGYVPEAQALIDRLDARRFVRLAAILHGRADADAAAAAALEQVLLDPDDRRPLRTYSKGMRQRVKLANALVHDPTLLVLDEPLNGLDPTQRHHMSDLLRRLGDEGRAVILSSHVLAEVEPLAERVLVLSAGRLVAEGDPAAIRELLDDRPHRLRLGTDEPARLGAALLDAGLITGARVLTATSLQVETTTIGAFRTRVATTARDRGLRLSEVVPLDDDLESVFRYLVDGGTMRTRESL